MPITYDVDHGRQRVLATALGDLRLEDIAAFATELSDAGMLTYSQRLDARQAAVLLSADDVRRFVSLIARLRGEQGQARTAFITDSDASFGMARMYASLAAESDSGFMVCRSIEDGNAWLAWEHSAAGLHAG